MVTKSCPEHILTTILNSYTYFQGFQGFHSKKFFLPPPPQYTGGVYTNCIFTMKSMIALKFIYKYLFLKHKFFQRLFG